MISNTALDTIVRVRTATSTLEAADRVADYLADSDIQIFASVLIGRSPSAAEGPQIACISNADDAYLAFYRDNDHERSDWGLRVHADERRHRPYFMGQGFLGELPGIRASEERFYTLAADWNLQSGIILPTTVPTPDGVRPAGHALWSAGEAPFFRQLIKERGAELALVMASTDATFLPVMQRRIQGYEALTSRERECLSLLASGLRAHAIADRLTLATVTVNLHLRRARQKLRAATMPEAVARAILTGAIKP